MPPPHAADARWPCLANATSGSGGPAKSRRRCLNSSIRPPTQIATLNAPARLGCLAPCFVENLDPKAPCRPMRQPGTTSSPRPPHRGRSRGSRVSARPAATMVTFIYMALKSSQQEPRPSRAAARETARVVAHFLVTGRVQGVGFRAFVRYHAQRLGLAGWVRNSANGAVEVLVAGSLGALAELETQLRLGPPAARVDSVERRPPSSDDAAQLDRYKDFLIAGDAW
jgi:acylphosphatase